MLDLFTPRRVYTVSALNRELKQWLEALPNFQQLHLQGEISNFKRHSSGHAYFTLKDAESQLAAVMFRSALVRNSFQSFIEGDRVEAFGSLTLYEARGQYQLQVERLVPAGVGELYKRYQRLKDQLHQEGLFAQERKRPLPAHPRHIAVVTSTAGVVFYDILRTLQRRGARLRITLVPSAVQGPEATPAIVQALSRAAMLPGVQLILLARGGGSLEDLWSFNEEAVVRAIATSPLPVITAIGHETDVTLADFVADLRASTPTAAAELLVPAQQQLQQELAYLADVLEQCQEDFFMDARSHIIQQRQRLKQALQYQLGNQQDNLQALEHQLGTALRRQLAAARTKLAILQTEARVAVAAGPAVARLTCAALGRTLAALAPHQVLARGYTRTHQRGKLVRSSAAVTTGELLTYFSDGVVSSQVHG